MRISDWSSDVCSSDLPEEVVEAVEAPVLDLQQGRADRQQRQLDPEHDPGQPEAADGGTEQPGLVLRPALHQPPVGAPQPEPPDVAAEAAGDLVVLAVDRKSTRLNSSQ